MRAQCTFSFIRQLQKDGKRGRVKIRITFVGLGDIHERGCWGQCEGVRAFWDLLVGVRCGATGFSFSSLACVCGLVLGRLFVLVLFLVALFLRNCGGCSFYVDSGFSGSARGGCCGALWCSAPDSRDPEECA